MVTQGDRDQSIPRRIAAHLDAIAAISAGATPDERAWLADILDAFGATLVCRGGTRPSDLYAGIRAVLRHAELVMEEPDRYHVRALRQRLLYGSATIGVRAADHDPFALFRVVADAALDGDA